MTLRDLAERMNPNADIRRGAQARKVPAKYHAAMTRGREDFEMLLERAVAERGIVMPGLNEAEVHVVDVPRHDFEGDRPIAQARKWAKENIVGEHTLIDSSGAEVSYSINGRTIDKFLSASAINKSDNVGAHLSVLKVLPAVIGESIEAEMHPDYSKGEDGKRSASNGLNESNLIHRFYGAVDIAGNIHRVKITIIENKTAEKKKPHSFEVSNVELVEETAGQDGREGTDTHHPRYSETSSERLISGNVATIPAAKLLQGVEKSYDKGKKLLDYSEKSLDRLHSAKSKSQAITSQDIISVAKVIKSFENPTIEEDESLDRMGDGYGAYSDAEVSFANDLVSKVMGKNRFSKKRQAEFAARERQRMADRVKELAERMHLDNVEVVTDASQLEGKRAKSKGFYNKRTGKITIVIPNNVSTIDAEQTLLHEAVAHYGLRKLFGGHFDTFLDNIYEAAEMDIRRKILDLAKSNGWNIRLATEEYLAGLAEDIDYEYAETSLNGWFNRIKGLFIDMLEKIGFKGFRDSSRVVLTDNELRYILWRSYQNMTEPGRHRSILGEAADIAKQSELKVGNYAERGIEAEYAAEPELNYDNDIFNTQLQLYIEGKLNRQEPLLLGLPKGVMKIFLPSMPIIMRQRILHKASEKKHNVALEALIDMPTRISKPIFVFQRFKL